ncbi:MAG: NADH/ubiquinone/plastoquinone (complex I) [Bradyrhizobiaceae bacterium]|nr:MAG: NADH/ubiquinone/plastoquinone (complex I) [Bradyrhizobiaceae bacterium]
MSRTGPLLLWLTFAGPLAMIAVAPLSRRPLRLLPWAAVPGLATALLAPLDIAMEQPAVLLGLHLRLDRMAAVFLAFGSLLWVLAGAYAQSYLAGSGHARSFAVFWLLTLAGLLGVVLAADVVTLYAAFSLMSLATFGLVIHDRTASARRAGLVYIVLAVLGEITLVAALMLAASGADSLLFADVSAAVARSPWSTAILAGLLVGFGIKVGLVPLHVWLPLAHPEAPTPASAVLSGVIVKAGIIGLMRLVPADGMPDAWTEMVVVLGVVTAYYGVLVGLTQTDAKAILAYSTLSQMGLLVAVLASGLAAKAAGTLDAVTLYASHHGLAKGALFLAIGVVAACGARWRGPVLVVTALAALAIAGLPLSGGAFAKLAIKDVAGAGATGTLVAVSAVGTALLMLRFLQVLSRAPGKPAETANWGLLVPWAAAAAAAFAVPVLWGPDLAGKPAAAAMSVHGLWTAAWPILFALAAAVFVLWRRWRIPLAIPRGDLVVLGETLLRRIGAGLGRLNARLARLFQRRRRWPAPSFDGLDTLEAALRRWNLAGPALVLVAALIAIALTI